VTILCIASCGNTKIWSKYLNAGPTKARDVYIGNFAKKCQEYTETFYPDSWCILSAKYGFLFPDDIVPGPYNVTFKSKKTNPITLKELSIQAEDKGIKDFDEFVVVGGKEYVKIVTDLFPGKGIHKPLEGCGGNGIMTHRMNNALKEGKPL
jgi:hypothetical protein